VRAPSPAAPHLLVVDDDPSVREALEAALHSAYVVHSAATGTHACTLLSRHPVAAIILDAILGDEHGLDFLDRFRVLSPVPILLLTGYSTEELAIRAVWAGVNGYLRKPPNLPALRAAVARLVAPSLWLGDPVERARQHLDQHLEKALDLADLAHQLGLSESHLRRRFCAVYGMTPHRYLTEARLRRAAELLRTSGQPITEIARRVGIADPRRFRQLFKACFGCSSSAYRPRPPLRTPREGIGDRNGDDQK